MASLKEVKTRINSVQSTRKITSAMKMVASAKLHKAQGAIEHMLPYQRQLNKILHNFLSGDLSIESPYVEEREVSVWLLSCYLPTVLCVVLSMPMLLKCFCIPSVNTASWVRIIS